MEEKNAAVDALSRHTIVEYEHADELGTYWKLKFPKSLLAASTHPGIGF